MEVGLFALEHAVLAIFLVDDVDTHFLEVGARFLVLIQWNAKCVMDESLIAWIGIDWSF